MRVVPYILVTLLALGASAPSIAEDDTRYAFTSANLPAGWKIDRSVLVSKALISGFSKKLGGRLVSLTNQDVSINGLKVRVNAITAASEDDAKKVETSMLRIRGADFVARTGVRVYEVASQNVLVARRVFAALGIGAEAQAVWNVKFRIALVDELDYTAGNRVFNHFLALEQDPDDASAKASIAAETKGWKLGTTLRLLDAASPEIELAWELDPKPVSSEKGSFGTTYTFEDPPRHEGVPYVDVAGRLEVRARYAPREAACDEGLVQPTRFWPVDHHEVRLTVRSATVWAKTDREKALALIERMRTQVRYGGPMGSRDGVLEVLSRGTGRCWDLSDILVTYARCAGIPARQVAGWLPTVGAGHVWTELYVDGGWLPVDATTTWLGTSPEYLPFFATQDGPMPVVYLGMPTIERVDPE